MTQTNRKGSKVIGAFIDALTWNEAIQQIIEWGIKRDSKTICLCNVHSSVTATEDMLLAKALSDSDMVLPDGSPVAWMLRRKGFKHQPRIAGPDLMYKICKQIEGTENSIFLFGSSEQTLQKLNRNLLNIFPELTIKGMLSPHYGSWSNAEEIEYINTINNSGSGIIFVGLGCPKQEIWMTNNKAKVRGVMLGVGAAFDFHAGTIKRAPRIYQRLGLEWLHRLFSEPRRLWKRYLITNTKFIYLNTLELFNSKY